MPTKMVSHGAYVASPVHKTQTGFACLFVLMEGKEMKKSVQHDGSIYKRRGRKGHLYMRFLLY